MIQVVLDCTLCLFHQVRTTNSGKFNYLLVLRFIKLNDHCRKDVSLFAESITRNMLGALPPGHGWKLLRGAAKPAPSIEIITNEDSSL
jgi:hypothetical protein